MSGDSVLIDALESAALTLDPPRVSAIQATLSGGSSPRGSRGDRVTAVLLDAAAKRIKELTEPKPCQLPCCYSGSITFDVIEVSDELRITLFGDDEPDEKGEAEPPPADEPGRGAFVWASHGSRPMLLNDAAVGLRGAADCYVDTPGSADAVQFALLVDEAREFIRLVDEHIATAAHNEA